MDSKTEKEPSDKPKRGLSLASVLTITVVALFVLFLAGAFVLFQGLFSSEADSEESAPSTQTQVATPTPTPLPTATPIPTPEPDVDTVAMLNSFGDILLADFEPGQRSQGDEIYKFYDAKQQGVAAASAKWTDSGSLVIIDQNGLMSERDRTGKSITIWDPEIRSSEAVRVETISNPERHIVLDSAANVTLIPAGTAATDDNSVVLYSAGADSSETATDSASETDPVSEIEDSKKPTSIAVTEEYVALLFADGHVEAINFETEETEVIWETGQAVCGYLSAGTDGFYLGVGSGYVIYALPGIGEGSQALMWEPDETRPRAYAFSEAGQELVVVLENGSVIRSTDWGDGTSPKWLWDVDTYRIKAVNVDSNHETAMILLTTGSLLRVDFANASEPIVLYEPSPELGTIGVIEFKED